MKAKNAKEKIMCAECGMAGEPRAFHPFAVCALFKLWRNSVTVEANIRYVIEYGMKAERAGVSVEDAMRDFNLVDNAKPATTLSEATAQRK